MKMPQTIGLVHFIGIGGIGMSGIAEVLHNLGYQVQGSDQADGANVQRLRDKGIACFVGHRAENLGDAEVVVVSTAIKKTNPELVAAREKLLPIVRRAEMLAELMRFRQAVAIGGTHGKTTTTSMVATLLDAGGLDPTVINGGIINAYGTNARMGEGEWMVVEADESDGTFLKLPADIAVVTNIDPEHLDHYGTFDKVREAFRQFVENVPFYGFGVMCTDHPEVQALVARIEDRRVITYGENAAGRRALPQSSASTARRRASTWSIRDRKTGGETRDRRPAPADARPPQRLQRHRRDRRRARARHVGGRDPQGPVVLRRRQAALHADRQLERRPDLRRLRPPPGRDQGGADGRRATLPRAASSPIAQPHRFTRLRDLFDDFSACFNDADTVMVAPVYAAGEDADRGRQLGGAGRAHPRRRPSRRALHRRAGGDRAGWCASLRSRGDFVVFLGAGNITQWAYALPKELGGEAGMSAADALLASARRPAGRPARPHHARRRDGEDHLVPRRRARPTLLFQPADEDDLAAFLQAVPDDVPVTVVGIGSNLLVREGGIRGVVVRLSAKGFGEAERASATRASAPARPRPTSALAAVALEAGIGGFHFYHGIPGAIGGALRMNAGANGVETRERVVEVARARPAGQSCTSLPMPTWAMPTGIRPRRRT